MGIELFEALCFVSLGVATLGIVFVGLGLILRATTRQEDEIVKWNFLRAIEDAVEAEHDPTFRDERVQNVKDQTQRGEIS